MPTDEPTATDALTRLPAERRQHKDEGIVLYACCCCCCCCLHTIGGVIGAAVAGNYRGEAPRDADEELDEDDFSDAPRFHPDQYRRRTLPGVQGLFWTSVLIVILLQMVIGGIWGLLNGAKLDQMVLTAPCALIMLGPLYFIAACVVLLIRIGINPALRRDGGYFRATLKIFLGSMAGTLAGIVLMVVPLVVVGAFR